MEKHTIAKTAASGRSLNVDLIRLIACFLVISVHFFPNTAFYGQEIRGASMFVLTLIRNFSMICVPLFMILTGYLSRHFVYDKKHVLRFCHILSVYFFSTLVCKLYRTCFWGYDFSVKNIVYGLIDFSGAPYAWYVEMYLGMLMMIPLLNAGWHSLGGRDRKIALCGFLLLSCGYTMIPGRSFFDYWSALYPVAYYFVGAYLAEARLNVKKRMLALLLVLSAALLALASYVRDYGGMFRAQAYVGHSSVYVLTVTLLTFVLLLKMDLSAMPKGISRLLPHAAKATLPAYLVSYCFDCSLYEPLIKAVPLAADQLPYYFLIVPVNFIGSLLIGYAVAVCSDMLMKPVRALAKRI